MTPWREVDDGASMHVLSVIDSLAPGGAESSLLAVAPKLVDRGIELRVAVLQERDGLAPAMERAGVPVISIDGPGRRAAPLRRLRQHIRRERPDLVHTTLFEADVLGRIAARTAGVPVVSSVVTEAYGSAHAHEPGVSRERLLLAKWSDAATAHLARRLHAVSKRVAEVTSRNLHYPMNRIDVIPRGRDPVELGVRSAGRRDAIRLRLGVDPHDRIVLAVARHEPAKGLDLLLAAVPQLLAHDRAIRVVVAGRTGNATEALHEMSSRLGLHDVVSFLGERADVPDLLCAADVLVAPSRREGFPGLLLEAMALEAPIVATDLPQVREVVGDDGALLVDPTRTCDLAGAIERVLESPDDMSALVGAARERFLAKFTIDGVADQTVSFYERAIGSPG